MSPVHEETLVKVWVTWLPVAAFRSWQDALRGRGAHNRSPVLSLVLVLPEAKKGDALEIPIPPNTMVLINPENAERWCVAGLDGQMGV